MPKTAPARRRGGQRAFLRRERPGRTVPAGAVAFRSWPWRREVESVPAGRPVAGGRERRRPSGRARRPALRPRSSAPTRSSRCSRPG